MYKHKLRKKEKKKKKKKKKKRKRKTEKQEKKEKEGLDSNLKQKLSKLDFDHSPQSNLFTKQ